MKGMKTFIINSNAYLGKFPSEDIELQSRHDQCLTKLSYFVPSLHDCPEKNFKLKSRFHMTKSNSKKFAME